MKSNDARRCSARRAASAGKRVVGHAAAAARIQKLADRRRTLLGAAGSAAADKARRRQVGIGVGGPGIVRSVVMRSAVKVFFRPGLKLTTNEGSICLVSNVI